MGVRRAPFLTLTGYEQVRSVVAEARGRRGPRRRSKGRARSPRERSVGLVLRLRQRVGCGLLRAVDHNGTRAVDDRLRPLTVTSTVDSAQRGTLEPRALRRVVAALRLTEIVSYGILYYAFTVLNASIVSDTGGPGL